MTEKEFMTQVVQFARLHRWRVYHTLDSRGSAAGFPDLVLVRGPAAVFAELKTDRGKTTAAQDEWLAALRAAGLTAVVWRPADWSEIERTLGGGA